MQVLVQYQLLQFHHAFLAEFYPNLDCLQMYRSPVGHSTLSVLLLWRLYSTPLVLILAQRPFSCPKLRLIRSLSRLDLMNDDANQASCLIKTYHFEIILTIVVRDSSSSCAHEEPWLLLASSMTGHRMFDRHRNHPRKNPTQARDLLGLILLAHFMHQAGVHCSF